MVTVVAVAVGLLLAGCAQKETPGIDTGPTGTSTSATSAPAEPTAEEASAETIYTCPMHPEVTSDKRDRCPECGMYLEPKES